MKALPVLIAFLLVSGCSVPKTSSGAGKGKGRSWRFQNDEVGAVPSGFTAAVGKWKIKVDSTAPSKDRVLAQLAKSSKRTYNVILATDTNYRDVDISVMMKSITGRIDRGGGLIWRAMDAKNYYIARYNPLEDNYRLYKVVAGKRSKLKSIDIERTPGWHKLRVTMSGDHIECYYDGKKYLDFKDSTLKNSGKIGIWTKADARTHFDDLTVTGL